jgi:aspartyl-tRNA(Asn)/glutamyl-tRNA(Gln) amidotransferase subunit A
MKGERLGPLHGIPVSIKDLALVKGVPAKFGSPVFEQRIGEVDAPFVRRLREAGAILTGKTSTPEFGWKALGDSPLTGITRNPWNTAMTSGGSSAGAGAAAAAGLGPLHQGSDGAGSVRVPSAFCGIYGLKPTFGRVPMWPVSNTDSASHVGPMTRTVADAALMLAVMAGPDDWDRQSLDAPPADYVGRLRDGVKGLRVGWSLDLGCCRVDPEIGQVARRAAEAFQELGCTVEDAKVSLPDTREMIHLMWNAHYAGNYAPFLEKFRVRMDPGLVAAYDLLLTPTVSVAAFEVGRLNPAHFPQHAWDWFPWAGFSYPFNFTGQPAATVPAGFTASGMPVGLQIVGRRLADLQVLQASAAFEEARPWAAKRPALG